MATKAYNQGVKEAKTGKTGSKKHENKESPLFKKQEAKGAKSQMKKKGKK